MLTFFESRWLVDTLQHCQYFSGGLLQRLHHLTDVLRQRANVRVQTAKKKPNKSVILRLGKCDGLWARNNSMMLASYKVLAEMSFIVTINDSPHNLPYKHQVRKAPRCTDRIFPGYKELNMNPSVQRC